MEDRFLLAADIGSPYQDPLSYPSGEIARSIVPGEVVIAIQSSDYIENLTEHFETVVPFDDSSFLFSDSATEVLAYEEDGSVVTIAQLQIPDEVDVNEVISRLNPNDDVLWAAPNYQYTGDVLDLTPNDPDYGSQYHHRLMGNDLAWDTTLGDSNVIVAVTDQGVELDHEDLADNLWVNPGEIPNNNIDDDGNGFVDDIHGWDFVTNDNDPSPLVNGDDHGTHVAGISAGVTNNAIGISGTSGGSSIMALRIQGSDGGFTSTIMANTFRYAIDNGALITNTSFNINGFVGDPIFTSGLQYYYDNGGLHFNSAGNANQLNPVRQSFHQTLLVASTTSADEKSSFSNYGTGIDVAAPGSAILSTVNGNGYGTKGGTSMAAPNAAGVAALVWSANPTWNRDQVAAAVLGTATNIDAENPAYIGLLGSGRVNSAGAIIADTLIGAPQVETLTLPANGSIVPLTSPISGFTLEFDQVMDPASINDVTNITLAEVGPNGIPGDADDIPFPITSTKSYLIGTNEMVYAIDSGALEAGTYVFKVDSDVANPFGKQIDGNADGTGGDEYQTVFEVAAPQVLPLPPLGSLVHEQALIGEIATVGEVESFSLDLDAGQVLTVAAEPSATLAPIIEVRDPAGALLGTATSVAGVDAVVQSSPVASGGTYTFTVAGDVSSLGSFSLSAFLNTAVEDERYGGAANDDFTTAQNIDSSRVLVGTAERVAVVGERPSVFGTAIESEDMESGALPAAWVTSAEAPAGQIRLTGDEGTAGGNFAMLMDVTTDGTDALNEAIWTVDLSGVTESTLRFFHAEWNDETDNLPASFTGSFDGDGVSISADGTTWHTVLNAPNTPEGVWTEAIIDLDAAAAAAGIALGADFRIKFQQFDNFSLPTDGRGYDEIEILVPDLGADWYEVTLNAGESASVVGTPITSSGNVHVDLFAADGTTQIAYGQPVGTNVGSTIDNYVVQTTGSHFVRVSGLDAEYSLVVTRAADFDTESNDATAIAQDLSGTSAVLGNLTAGDVDVHQISLLSGDSLTLETRTPGDGPRDFENDLDPRIELISPGGAVVASNSNGAIDGRNAVLTFSPTESGYYTVRVIAESGTNGEYALFANGATGPFTPFTVANIDPPFGSTFGTGPTSITIDFNDSVLLTSLDAGDLLLDGVAALGVTPLDHDTVVFDVPSATEGLHLLSVVPGSILDLQGTPIEPFVSEFSVDQTGPRVTDSSIQEGDTLSGNALTYVAQFDSELDATNLGIEDVTLTGAVSGDITPSGLVYNPVTSTVFVNFLGLPEDRYTLTLTSGNGAFEDLYGNDLDGEPLSFPIPTNVSGNGLVGGDFVVNFTSDIDVGPFPAALHPRLPLGSLVYEGSFVGLMNSETDVDTFTIDLDPDQTIAFEATPNANLKVQVELLSPSGDVLTSQASTLTGSSLFSPAFSTHDTGAGPYSIRLTAIEGEGTLDFRLVLNAELEQEDFTGVRNEFVGANLDQASIPRPGISGHAIGRRDAQVFTAGMSGYLDSIRVQVYQSDAIVSGDLWIDLWPVDTNGLPIADYDNATPIASSLIVNSDIPTLSSVGTSASFVSADFASSGVTVTAGEQYAIVARRTVLTNPFSPPWMVWGSNNASSYSGGGHYYEFMGSWLPRSSQLGFETYISNDLVGELIDDSQIPIANSSATRLAVVGDVSAGNPDVYNFTVNSGEATTFVVESDGDVILELQDASEAVLATGVSARNMDQVIHSFVSDTTSTYFARITGTGSYNFAIVRGGDFDTEGNSSPDAAQLLQASSFVMGHVGEPPAQPTPAFNGPTFNTEVDPADALDRIIVQFADGVSDAQVNAIADANNATLHTRITNVFNGAVFNVAANESVFEAANRWESLPEVSYVEVDQAGEYFATPNDTQFGSMWGLNNTGQTGGTPDADIDAPEAWDLITDSSSVVIAIVDSGVDYNHPDLNGAMWVNPGEIAGNGIDDDANGFVDDVFGIDADNLTGDPMDGFGHGTHVAGTTAAIGNNGVGVTGVNWNAQIMALGIGTAGPSTAAAIVALDYMVDQKVNHGVNIVSSNHSYGVGPSLAFETAIQSSIDAGIVFVAAAGNSAQNIDINPSFPAGYPLDGIISVAATDHNDAAASFTNFGAVGVDLGAPGVSILSTMLTNTGGINDPSGYGAISGTSMASPHVAGAAALLAAFNPTASVADIKAALMDGSDPIASMTGITVSGGRLNLRGALENLIPTQPPEPPEDYYSVNVSVGHEFTVWTTTPLDGPRLPANSLDPAIELYDPAGNLVALDDNSAPDGRNAILSYTALESGNYTIHVTTSNEGEYTLQFSGDSGINPAPYIADSTPQDGEYMLTFPTTYAVTFSEQLLLPTVQASDVLFDGIPANSMTQIDGRTFEFGIPASVDVGDAVYTVQLPAGAVEDLQGIPNHTQNRTFVVDTIPPKIVDTAWNSAPLPADLTFPPDAFVFDAFFSEPIQQPDIGAAILFDSTSGTFITPDLITLNEDGDQATISFPPLPEGEYQLTLTSGDAAFEDLGGINLDGEPLGAKLDGAPTGDDIPGGDYVINFTVDNTSPPFPINPFRRITPLGGLLATSGGNRGYLNFSADVDTFSFSAQAGEVISGTVFDLSDSDSFTSIELVGVGGPYLGENANLPPQTIPADGIYEIRVSGFGVLHYQLDIHSGFSIEPLAPTGESGDGRELAIDDAFIPLGVDSGRFAVFGNSSEPTGPAFGELYGIDVLTNQIRVIDPTSGNFGRSFASPLEFVGPQTGLTGAENGGVLVLQGSENPEVVYIIDPATGDVLSEESMAPGNRSGLSFQDGTLFSIENNLRIDRQDEFSGPIVPHTPQEGDLANAPTLPGALGGDDLGRHFYLSGDSIVEFDPFTPNTLINSFPAPEDSMLSGLAYDGQTLFALDIDNDLLFWLNPQNGEIWAQIDTQGEIAGLAIADPTGGSDENTNESVPSFNSTAEVTEANVLINGGFETGDFTGWTVNNPVDPLAPWAVDVAGASNNNGLIPTSPPSGIYNAWNGFDGGGPMEYTMYQDAIVPFMGELSWQHRIQWNFNDGGDANIERTLDVEILDPVTGALLETAYTFGTGTQAVNLTGDTDWVSVSYDLSAYEGQSVRIMFRETIPENYTGPGQIEFDTISLDTGFFDVPDFDEYTVDLTGKAGQPIDIVLEGQITDFSGQVLELIDIDGETVLATGSSHYQGIRSENIDLGIYDFIVPTDGEYTVRVVSRVPGDYAVVVSDPMTFDTEPNNAGDPLRELSLTDAALGYLEPSDPIDQYSVELTVGQTIVINTHTPFDRAASTTVNDLDPSVQVLNPSGVTVAQDTDSASDDRNAYLLYTAPADGVYMIQVQRDFGEGEYFIEVEDAGDSDFGDAPASYQTLLADNGAQHLATGPTLGLLRDVETNGQPSADALADDTAGTSDEDGVQFGVLRKDSTAAVNIDLQNAAAAFIDAWIDFDANGNFDPGEQILTNAPATTGLQTLNFAIPAGATLGDTYARVRVSSAGNLSHDGIALDGEVEDYLVTIREDIALDLNAQSNDLTVWLNGTDVEVIDNLSAGAVLLSAPVATLQMLNINGNSENDKLTIDFDTGGFFHIPGGIVFDADAGYDELIVDGNGTTTAIYQGIGGPLGEAELLVQASMLVQQIEFSDVQPLSVTGMQEVVTTGDLHVGSETFTIESATPARINTTTIAGGTILSAGGLELAVGELLLGTGTIDTPNDAATPAIIDGTIQGDNPGAIALTGFVTGTGSLSNVSSQGTYSPGASPAQVTNGSVAYDPAGTVALELAGLAAGSEHDQVLHIGSAQLDGSLKVDLIEPFVPVEGDSFVLITATGGISGSFQSADLPELTTGLGWALNYNSNQLEAVVISAPRVETVEINDGDGQRSQVHNVVVTFNTSVNIDESLGSAFSIINRDTAQSVDYDKVVSVLGDKTVVTLTFLPGPVVEALGATPPTLVDGNYELIIDATKVGAGNLLLDGNDDGIGGDDFHFGNREVDAFFRYYGDYDGDRDVDLADLNQFGSTFRMENTDGNYNQAFDRDGDGDVDIQDLAHFGDQFRTNLDF